MHHIQHNPWRSTLAAAGIFLAIGGAGWLMLGASRREFTNFVMRGDPGPFFLADLCLAAIGLAGVILAARGGAQYLQSRAEGIRLTWSVRDWLIWLVPALFVASLLVLPWAMRALGSTLALSLFAVAWMAALLRQSGAARRRVVLMPLAGGLATAGFVDLVFVRLLNLPLPN